LKRELPEKDKARVYLELFHRKDEKDKTQLPSFKVSVQKGKKRDSRLEWETPTGRKCVRDLFPGKAERLALFPLAAGRNGLREDWGAARVQKRGRSTDSAGNGRDEVDPQ